MGRFGADADQVAQLAAVSGRGACLRQSASTVDTATRVAMWRGVDAGRFPSTWLRYGRATTRHDNPLSG